MGKWFLCHNTGTGCLSAASSIVIFKLIFFVIIFILYHSLQIYVLQILVRFCCSYFIFFFSFCQYFFEKNVKFLFGILFSYINEKRRNISPFFVQALPFKFITILLPGSTFIVKYCSILLYSDVKIFIILLNTFFP